MTLHTGCEILYTDASPHLLKEGHYPSLAETWTVLVEFSGDVPYSRMCEAARLFGNAGFTVIFAHVERFDPMRNFKHVRELREEYGVYMQMNANTVLMKKGFLPTDGRARCLMRATLTALRPTRTTRRRAPAGCGSASRS